MIEVSGIIYYVKIEDTTLQIYSLNKDLNKALIYSSLINKTGEYPTLIEGLNDDIYLLTHSQGQNQLGSIVSIKLDGSQFTTLHEFSQRHSQYFLTKVDNSYFGIISNNNYNSALFEFSPINGFELIHEFNHEFNINCKLTYFENSLYGIYDGGDANRGRIFKIATDGTSFELIKSFTEETSPMYTSWWGELNLLPDNSFIGSLSVSGENKGAQIFRVINDTFIPIFDFPYNNSITGNFLLHVRQPQTITFNAINNKQIGDVFELEASTNSGLPVTFTSSSPNILSINGTTATVHAAGEVTITAKAAGNDVYLEAYDVTQVFSTSRLTQTITFNAIGNKQIGDVFELVATSSSGLPVMFTSSNPNIVSINGATATVLAAGEVTLTAKQEGNDVYLQANDVTQNLLVIVLDVQPEENFYISEPYPNPNDGTCINFNIKQPSGVSLNIYLNTLLGSELGNTTLFANGEDEKVCIASNLKQGTYLVSIKSSTGFVKVYKVVVP
ncbi:MAG: T9SS type A sorting domain-containing protein [Cyclobacteriaceae bacterium]|jgi:hypothetical protein|nr:T9SS type A sorting domain-containing protein [Cyclobacteriaceae bacterium]